MAESRVLVLSRDHLAAALLGFAIELAGGRPSFAAPGESERDALRRLRPALALVDGDDVGRAERVVGLALMTGARVAVFRAPRAQRDIGELANRLGVRELRLASDVDALATLVRESLD